MESFFFFNYKMIHLPLLELLSARLVPEAFEKLLDLPALPRRASAKVFQHVHHACHSCGIQITK